MAAIRPTAASTTVANWILAMTALLFFLRRAKHLLIPIALAALASYALAPVVSWLERRVAQRGGVTAALQMSAAAIVITSLEGWLLTPALMGKSVADHVDRLRPIGRLMAP